MSEPQGEAEIPVGEPEPERSKSTPGDEPGKHIVNPVRKMLTLFFCMISVAVVAWVVFFFTGAPLALLVPLPLGLVAFAATVMKEELRAASVGLQWPIAAGALAALISTNVATAAFASSIAKAPPLDESAAFVEPHTGADPARTQCVEDAKIASSDDSHPEFLFELLFSPQCQAGWARVTRKDQAAIGNQISISIYRRADPSGLTRQDALEPDVHSAYTTMILREDPTDRLCAEGSITLAQNTISSRPLCI